MALTFDDSNVYALTCNLTTGAYNVYTKSLDTPGPMSIADVKQKPAGTMVTTDSAKIVTLYEPSEWWFYVQDDDRSSGIKVIPQYDQPLGSVGQRAQITGFTDVVNGEAVIYATSVVLSSTDDEIAPLAMPVRSVGGGKLGIQPPTLAGNAESSAEPAGLNTTGLLIRVAGKLVADEGSFEEFIDDGSGFPLRIDFPPGTGGFTGDTIAVTGVSRVYWDSNAKKGFRTISPRDYGDIDIF